MFNCVVFLCFVVDSIIGTATDSPQWTSLNFFFGYSYFIFKTDFSKQSTIRLRDVIPKEVQGLSSLRKSGNFHNPLIWP